MAGVGDGVSRHTNVKAEAAAIGESLRGPIYDRGVVEDKHARQLSGRVSSEAGRAAQAAIGADEVCDRHLSRLSARQCSRIELQAEEAGLAATRRRVEHHLISDGRRV